MTTPSTPQTLPEAAKIALDAMLEGAPWMGIQNGDGEEIGSALDASIFALQAALAAQTQAVAENIREGVPYDDPRFEALCREHGIWGTAQAALCAVFWRQAVAVPANLADAVLSLNTAWNQKETEDVIAGKLDLCRRLALDAASPQAAGQQDA